MDPLTRLVHLAALAVYGGTTLALVLMVLPMAEQVATPAQQRRLLARALTPYNLLSVGALGVLIMSGASTLTGLKAAFGADYAALIWPLAAKLALTFALTMVGTYLSFGLAHRLVRAERLGDTVDGTVQQGMLRRLRYGAWLALILALWTAWAGIGLRTPTTRPPIAPPAAPPA